MIDIPIKLKINIEPTHELYDTPLYESVYAHTTPKQPITISGVVPSKPIWTMDACGQTALREEIAFQRKYGDWYKCPKCDYLTWVSSSAASMKCGKCNWVKLVG